jgi:16S rRNA (cytosine1402-N4)-methyltransferase
LEQKGELIAIDKDHEAINSAKSIQDERFEIYHSSILNFAKSLKKKVLMGYSWI